MWLRPDRVAEAAKFAKKVFEEAGLTPRQLWSMPTADIFLLFYAEPVKPQAPVETLREKSIARGGPPYCPANALRGCRRTRKGK